MASNGDDATTSANDSPAGETKTQREARVRRERRQAKLQEGGSARLNKILASSGRDVAAEAELAKAPTRLSTSAPPNQQPSNQSRADDPSEVDISNMFNAPGEGGSISAEQQRDLFRQMLAASGPQDPNASGQNHSAADSEDPMIRMMQQMLGSADAIPGSGGAGGAAAQALPDLLSSFMGGGAQQPQAPQPSADYIWRIVHALFSLSLGFYATLAFTFNGSELERTNYAGDGIGPRLFWIFATVEVILQSSRYFLDKGRLPSSGIMSTVSRFLPEPYANYVRILSRYSIIYMTIVNDAMVIVFVLGCIAWWKGASDV